MDKLTLIVIAKRQPRRAVSPGSGCSAECAACCLRTSLLLEQSRAPQGVYAPVTLLNKGDPCDRAWCASCGEDMETFDAP